MSLVANNAENGCSTLDVQSEPASRDHLAWIRAASRDWPSLIVQGKSLALLELMLRGAMDSHCKFMTSVEDESVRCDGRLPDGTPWLAALLLPVPKSLAATLQPRDFLALRDTEGVMLAALRVDEVWNGGNQTTEWDASGNQAFLAGRVIGIQQPVHYSFRPYRQTAADLRLELFADGLPRPIAFVTARPIHRATFDALMKIARHAGRRVLIIGAVPVDSDTREFHSTVRCWLHVVERSAGLLRLSLWPIPDPLTVEGLFLATLVAQSSGCKSFLVENCPEPIREKLSSSTGLPVRNLQSEDVDDGEALDPHTEVITCLREGRPVPASVTFPEVARELSSVHRSPEAQGVTVFFTGLSGSGKSTIANALQDALLARGSRSVTLLDGDVVRQHLSSELGFSREHRELNVTRIGFVAMEIAKHGGIAICAPIAPYEELRARVRRMIEPHGIFVLVYVSTPLEVCEQRDRKGLYARARHGLIENFTGISDVYEAPGNADVVIDTSVLNPSEAAELILSWLVARGCLAADSKQSDADYPALEQARAAAAATNRI